MLYCNKKGDLIMELKETIENRRSIRKFKNNPIPKEEIEDLINCARLAPSAKNRQPWKFIVVNETIKNQITTLMLEKENNSKISLERKIYHANSSVKQTAKIMQEAPILILVLKKYDNAWLTGDSLSIGASIEHICLRATDLGLGSLWIRDITYTQKEIAKLVGHEEWEVISAISIGYPDEMPNARPRKSLKEILEWI